MARRIKNGPDISAKVGLVLFHILQGGRPPTYFGMVARISPTLVHIGMSFVPYLTHTADSAPEMKNK